MDELVSVLSKLLSNAKENRDPPGGTASAGTAGDEYIPVSSGDSTAGDTGAQSGDLAELLRSMGSILGKGGEDGKPDLHDVFHSLGEKATESSARMSLLLAIKPHLRQERRDKIEKACSILNTAYGVRAALTSIGGILNV